MIPRTGGGRFTRSVLDCIVCNGCGVINLPTYTDDTNGFVTKEYPTNCHSCGEGLRGGVLDGDGGAEDAAKE
jgi:hypothetical protein